MDYLKKLISKNILPNLLCGILIFCYTTVSLSLVTGRSLQDFTKAIIFSIIIFTTLQVIVSPVIDYLMFSKMSRTLEIINNDDISQRLRTRTFEDLMMNPLLISVKVFLLFSGATIFLTVYYIRNLDFSARTCITSLTEGLCGSVFAALFGYGTTNKISSEYAYGLVQKGLDPTYVKQKKHFGMKLATQMNVYITLPVVMNAILANIIMFSSFTSNPDGSLIVSVEQKSQTLHMILICAINIVLQIVMVCFFYIRTNSSTEKMRQILESMSTADLDGTNYVDTDIKDETAYNHYLANNLLTLLQNTLNQFESIGTNLRESSLNLSHISTETNATYLEQSSGTTEVVSSMRLTTEKSHQIKNKISEVAKLAQDTETDVQNGNNVLETYYNNIRHIEEHNKETINGIQELTSKINSIWDVVSIINSIADQTKIIAFNAELESTGFKEKGNNFKNVSNEIRRLANSTVDSTREIKERINIIQDSVDELKTSLENTMPSISRGRNLVEDLKVNFDNILASANTNAHAAIEISGLISEQSASFEQIENTLQEINIGLKNFEEATSTIANSSQEMQKSANDLSKISKTGENHE